LSFARLRPFSVPSIEVTTVDDLPETAKALLQQLMPGSVVGLDGPMGVGKTTLIKAMAHVLGITEPVNSPTFGYIHAYTTGVLPVLHADLYRLGEATTPPNQALQVAQDCQDWLTDNPTGLAFIEWPQYGQWWLPQWQTHCLSLTCNATHCRNISLSAIAPQSSNAH
jgi:tRNA threonylcarbamoyladenosine biosynthesis protein TsaE